VSRFSPLLFLALALGQRGWVGTERHPLIALRPALTLVLFEFEAVNIYLDHRPKTLLRRWISLRLL